MPSQEVVLMLREDLLDPERYDVLRRCSDATINAYYDHVQAQLGRTYGHAFDLFAGGNLRLPAQVHVYDTRPRTAPQDPEDVTEHVRSVAIEVFDRGDWRGVPMS